MNQLTYYTKIASEILAENPELHEVFEEEINIIIHKLKFIQEQDRPLVQLVDGLNNLSNNPYLEELTGVAGGKSNTTNKSEEINILIFHETSPIFLSNLPTILTEQYAQTNAFKNNKIYIIQKSDFSQNKQNYILDTAIFAEIIQPKYFVFGHEGIHWIQFSL